MKWTEKDVAEVAERGKSLQEVDRQLEMIKSGPAELRIDRACTPGDGIHVFQNSEIQDKIERFENRDENISVAKFVPASGAASRMFRHLHEYLNGEESELAKEFFNHLPGFAFSAKVQENFAFDITKELTEEQKKEVAEFLMSEDGLSNIPKGLVGFHCEGEVVKSAFEEQIAEGVEYLKGDEPLSFHFTVAPFFRSEIDNHLKAVILKPEFSDIDFDFLLSVQEPATDTIAATEDGDPFRDDDGDLLFRPGGHGALLLNLQESRADVVFVKNIDNVVHRDHLQATIKWKKALAGCLLELQETTFQLIEHLKSEKEGATESAKRFLKETLGLEFDDKVSETDQLISLLDRPLRVCGMVKNQGEPGGGPFWVTDDRGVSRPQIVEKAQINLENETHRQALESATHFNPVDIVCSMKRYNGEFFNLLEFVDESAFFVSEKSKDGRELKALELPGLWNGAMAHWNSFFVEVPLETFNPVKTVNDLLKPLHQPAG